MIDIHSHILSGLDDGAQSMRDSLEMARAAVNNGIRKVVATPHHRTSRYDSPKTIILEKIVQLNEAIQQENIPLEVLVGQKCVYLEKL